MKVECFVITLRLVEQEFGGDRGIQASSDSVKKIRRDGHPRNNVFEDKSLVLQFLPLRCSEWKPTPCSTHHSFTKEKTATPKKDGGK